jgi:hypothetical protein
LEKNGDSIDEDPIYWESDNNEETPVDPIPEETPIVRQAPMRKIITRNVGNTQRRRFR